MDFKTVNKDVQAEITEKKSKFIANLIYVNSVQEAEERIKEIKKKYYDARHNCYAFSVMEGNMVINRNSDDGEPSGTAGLPIMNVINKNDLVNVLVVVTRYFGGILLGTGGLVRAYSNATIKAIEEAEIVFQENGEEVKCTVSYDEIDKVKYYCKINNINIMDIQYGEKIDLYIEVNEKEKQRLIEEKGEGKPNILEIISIKQKYIKKKSE